MSDMPAPTAPAGWYPHPTMTATQAYWDGQAWTEHIAPAVPPTDSPSPGQTLNERTQPCPYCRGAMPYEATRCPSCAGELLWCTRCNDLVATTSKQKFVGMARGGMKTQVRCARCSKILDGPWF